jgi:hypothetical protein
MAAKSASIYRGFIGAPNRERCSFKHVDAIHRTEVFMQRRRYIQFAAVLLFALTGWACKNSIGVNQDEDSEKALVVIQLESDFQNDSVTVEFDSQPLLVGRVRTNYSIALAWSSDPLTVPTGVHTVRVSVLINNTVGHTSAYMHDTTVVTVNYDRQTRQLKFLTYDHFILRR